MILHRASRQTDTHAYLGIDEDRASGCLVDKGNHPVKLTRRHAKQIAASGQVPDGYKLAPTIPVPEPED